jgi:hypothetical protein
VAVTLYRKNANADLTKLLRFFPATVELPPPPCPHISARYAHIPGHLSQKSGPGRLNRRIHRHDRVTRAALTDLLGQRIDPQEPMGPGVANDAVPVRRD